MQITEHIRLLPSRGPHRSGGQIPHRHPRAALRQTEEPSVSDGEQEIVVLHAVRKHLVFLVIAKRQLVNQRRKQTRKAHFGNRPNPRLYVPLRKIPNEFARALHRRVEERHNGGIERLCQLSAAPKIHRHIRRIKQRPLDVLIAGAAFLDCAHELGQPRGLLYHLVERLHFGNEFPRWIFRLVVQQPLFVVEKTVPGAAHRLIELPHLPVLHDLLICLRVVFHKTLEVLGIGHRILNIPNAVSHKKRRIGAGHPDLKGGVPLAHKLKKLIFVDLLRHHRIDTLHQRVRNAHDGRGSVHPYHEFIVQSRNIVRSVWNVRVIDRLHIPSDLSALGKRPLQQPHAEQVPLCRRNGGKGVPGHRLVDWDQVSDVSLPALVNVRHPGKPPVLRRLYAHFFGDHRDVVRVQLVKKFPLLRGDQSRVRLVLELVAVISIHVLRQLLELRVLHLQRVRLSHAVLGGDGVPKHRLILQSVLSALERKPFVRGLPHGGVPAHPPDLGGTLPGKLRVLRLHLIKKPLQHRRASGFHRHAVHVVPVEQILLECLKIVIPLYFDRFKDFHHAFADFPALKVGLRFSDVIHRGRACLALLYSGYSTSSPSAFPILSI